ncbi:hypothetical protein P1P91_06215 [Halomonas piscis]|uniref:DUF7282 domain-containing protein n=1 Tax=Halomonas piscis TaxID=3031727 RepID=A0ABY9Z3P5_9GAMM|nr:hypothetical protein [Halomonas piscis]WNK21265.1 hypothetical protein P1P91_06215 [Halomonas piscis]
MTLRNVSLSMMLALGLAGTAGTAMAADGPSLEADAQSPGKEVTVSVTADEKGFVVIHDSNEEGKPVAPASIGHAAIDGQDEVTVEVDRELESGDKVFAMLHKDTGEEGKYEFGEGSTDVDPPMMADGEPVVIPVDVE